MRKINWKKLNTKETASIICDHLARSGFDAVLTGGGCVCIYSHNKYRSGDLDFVMPIYDLNKIDETMLELGFKRTKHHRHYRNPACPYFVEFPPPPLAIGEEIVKDVSAEKTKMGTLKLLTATDCVKDRLAAYYHWNDAQSLEQAVLVASEQKIDLKNIKKWSANEGELEKFEMFKSKLKI